MVKLAVCDDDKEFLLKLNSTIKEFNKRKIADEEISVLEFTSPIALRDGVRDNDIYDIFILDIEMPELDGIQLAKDIKKVLPNSPIIFLTSHTDYSYVSDGYKVSAFRYISKSEVAADLSEALEAAISEVHNVNARSKYIVIPHYRDSVRVFIDKIVYVQRTGRILEIATVNEQDILHDRKPLRDFYEQLSDERFIYIDRSCFVNLDYVHSISDKSITLANGNSLPISRKCLPIVRDTIMRLWGSTK